MTAEQLHATVCALQDMEQTAQQAASPEAAQELRAQLAQHRIQVLLDLQREGLDPTVLDVVFLHDLGADLCRLGLHESALLLFAAARGMCQERGDGYAVLFFELKGAQIALESLDFAAAEQVLARVLSPAGETLPEPSAAFAAARALFVPRAEERDLHELRALALFTLGRFYAAIGLLGSAGHIFAAVLDLLEDVPSTLLAAEELAILLAETLIDRGDFAGWAALHRNWAARNLPAAVQVKWQILFGSVLHLQGKLSQSEAVLAQAAAAAHTAQLLAEARAAMAQRVHVLGLLNRLDEAEHLIAQLSPDGNRGVALLQALLQARRSATDTGTSPLTAREVLAQRSRTADRDLEAPLLQPLWCESSAADAPDGTPCRTSERVREDWAALANQIQLDLHQGGAEHNQRALQRFTWLSEWSAELDSPLLQARLSHLGALVAYYTSDLVASEARARGALQACADLGLLPLEWATCRLYRRTLRHLQAPAGEIHTFLAREQVLLQQQKAVLGAADRICFSLNKWSVVDEAVAEQCQQMAAAAVSPTEPGWLRYLAELHSRRRILTSLRQIITLKRWDALAETVSDAGEVPVPAAGSDVYGWAREQIRLREGRRLSRAGLALHGLPADTAVLVYVTLPERLALCLLHRASCQIVHLPHATSRVALQEQVRLVLERMQYAGTWPGEGFQRKALERLSESLGLAAALALLPAGIRHLCIVPDNVLFSVPYAALPVGGKPLVAGHSLAILPHLTWSRHPGGRAGRSGLGVAVANTTLPPSAGPYPELQHAALELAAMDPVVRPQARRNLVNEKASKASVLAALPQAQIIHFACHGEYSMSAPHRSGLVLQDALLTCADLRAITLQRAEVVVMGACWGANIKVLPGRELVGVPVAFLEQGAGTVVAALWEVRDDFSAQFAAVLYKEMRHVSAVEALARAQRSCVEGLDMREWASYLAYADGLQPQGWRRWLRRVMSSLGRP